MAATVSYSNTTPLDWNALIPAGMQATKIGFNSAIGSPSPTDIAALPWASAIDTNAANAAQSVNDQGQAPTSGSGGYLWALGQVAASVLHKGSSNSAPTGATVQPASYTTASGMGGMNGFSPFILVGFAAVAALAVYEFAKK